MSKKKNGSKAVAVLLVLVILAAALLGAMIWFVGSHFFVKGKAYPKTAESLDLRNQILSVQEYEAIRQQLPQCSIRWNIPFQNSAYPDDTTKVSVGSLSDEDVERLAYFKKLEEVDADGCRDYAQLKKLQERYPADAADTDAALK